MRHGESRSSASTRTATSMLLLVILSSSARAQNGTHLAWQFEAGESFRVSLQTSVKTVAIQAGQAFEIPQDRVLELSLTVSEVNSLGVASIGGRLTRIHFNTRTPFAGEIDLDSAGVDDGEPEKIQQMQQAFGKAAGLRLSFQWKPTGQTEKLQWLDEFPEEVEQHALLASMLQAEFLQSMLNSTVQLPPQPIDTEDTWTYQDQRPTAAGPIIFTHTASRQEAAGDNEKLVQISVKTDAELEASNADDGVTYSVSNSQCQGMATFDTELKKVVSSRQQQRLVFSVEKEGATGEQKLSQNVSFTLTPQTPTAAAK